MCQTQARGPNLASNVIVIGPRDLIVIYALELAYSRPICSIFHFKYNFSYVCNIKLWLFQVQGLSKITVCFLMKGQTLRISYILGFNNVEPGP